MNCRAPCARANVLGVGISAIDLPAAVHFVLQALQSKCRGYICVTGAHGVIEAQADRALRGILNRAYLCTPDGMPTVWMSRLMGYRNVRRVYGPDLMLEVCHTSIAHGFRHFVYGGANGTAERLRKSLCERFPGLQIVGTFEPPFRALNAAEEIKLKDEITAARPDVMWVGLSTPKQEKFMAEYLAKLDVTLMIGVGAAFDFHTGQVKQAPRWMQRSGLEWMYRVYREPRRLWRRYFKVVPQFIYLAAAQLLGFRTIALEEPA